MDDRTWNFHNSYARLLGLFFTRQHPTPVPAPRLVLFNDALAHCLGVPMQPEVFGGNAVPAGAEPLAQAYAGHQFGYFAMLGDGRAVLLGEHVTQDGRRFDIQLKGSGRTPYSRGGDGRAALGPMLREYIISEAMAALGIPTTRSLAVVTTGQAVRREEPLTGAVLTRVAKSHIRVGTFEYAAHFGTAEDVRSLADYTLARHFPQAAASENAYLLLLRQVVERQAALIAQWQLVGFVHGVMNTDNMAISGETIDYGPCAFMDRYDPATVFSSIDTQGRYAYENQPKMAAWNLARFAETLLPLLSDDPGEAVALARQEVSKFQAQCHAHWLAGMGAKLGLPHAKAEDEGLIHDFLQLLQQYQGDYTGTFRQLTLGETDDQALFSSPEYAAWYRRWQKRVGPQAQSGTQCSALMRAHNPAIIPRNHLVEAALSAAERGDMRTLHTLVGALSNPYGYTPEQTALSQLPPPEFCNYKTFCGT